MIVEDDGEDPLVVLRNPIGHLYHAGWPDNMFLPERIKLSQLR